MLRAMSYAGFVSLELFNRDYWKQDPQRGREDRAREDEGGGPRMKTSSKRLLEWADRLAKLYTPVVADVLDKLGFRCQCHALAHPPAVARGEGRRVRAHGADSPGPRSVAALPYAGELAAVDSLAGGDVLVVSESAWSFWGELLSTAAKYRGCRGVVLDGPTRDSTAIRAMGFPVFHVGFHPADSLGRLDVVDHNVPIECGGVLVYPGDLVLADHDGVVIVPNAAAEADAATRGGESERREPRPQGVGGRDDDDRGVQEIRNTVTWAIAGHRGHLLRGQRGRLG